MSKSTTTPKRKGASDGYLNYIRSPEWRLKSNKCLDAANRICQRCKERRATQAHHLTYARLFHELPLDLMAVCKPCHEAIHGRSLSRTPIPVNPKSTRREQKMERRRERHRLRSERRQERNRHRDELAARGIAKMEKELDEMLARSD